tara:strand:+ start:3374 stop:3727 length:354 start_codon:yes stop_codon:yes gene_type:complete
MEEIKNKIYKLHYTDKATGDADLIAKGVYEVIEVDGINQDIYVNGTQSVVYIGKIVEIPGTYDPDGHEITPPVYYDGVFYDVMTTAEIDFSPNEVFPENYVHTFAGYLTHPEVEEKI